MATYWHVTRREWDGGDLLPWRAQVDAGLVADSDWYWTDAPIGMDGDGVCLYESREAAEDHVALFDGVEILRCELPVEIRVDRTVEESIAIVRCAIPAEYITRE